MTRPKATLVINRYDSKCGACRLGADPHELHHDTVLDWEGAGVPGCGVKWEYVSTDYPDVVSMLPTIRPDLEVVK
jgi:hypothetical protein